MPWIDIGARAELGLNGILEVEVGGVALLLYDIGGAIYATAAVCPHHAAWLSQGQISGETIDCPRHRGQFHIPTGRKLRGPECPDLRCYPVRIASERISVLL